MIRIGPAGIGPVKDTKLESYCQKGFEACEIPFTYGVYIKEGKHDKAIQGIRKKVGKLGINLSIHAPYWINLNGNKEVVGKSKERILRAARIGEKLGASKVVFHPGYYCDKSKRETYERIKKNILDIKEKIDNSGWDIELAPETTGKVDVFGDDKEILKLVEDTNCSLCVDFAHLLARSNGKREYEDMVDKFSSFKKLHTHFSGIEFGEKGERKHISASEKELEKLFEALPKNKDITMISEDPDPVEGAKKMMALNQ